MFRDDRLYLSMDAVRGCGDCPPCPGFKHSGTYPTEEVLSASCLLHDGTGIQSSHLFFLHNQPKAPTEDEGREEMFMKHLFTILLALVATTASAQTFKVDGIYYNILSEDDRTVMVISGADEYKGDIVIPEEVIYDSKVYLVTTIRDRAFGGCDALTSVSMPSVTTIGDNAFSGCDALTSVSMPSVTTIGDRAFYYCSALTSVDIPASCTSIAGNPFLGCESLEEIVVDENNPNYSSEDGVLYDKNKETLIYCPLAKTEVNIPSSATAIGDDAFYGCDALTSVSMPSVTTIGDRAFYYCSALTSVSMPSVTTIGFEAFISCRALRSVSMPSVTTIGDEAFNYCDGLTSVEMPAVTTIGDEAFYGCSSLTSVSMPVATTIGDRAFGGCFALTSVSMPSVTTIGGGAFGGCSTLTSIEMPSVTTINEMAFSSCYALTSVNIPASCTSIVGNSFQECKSLEEIVVDENNPNYSSMDGVLYDKDKTTLIGWPAAEDDIDIMPSVTTIGDYAFNYCDGLTSVEMPAVTTIGDYAFSRCNALTSVSMPSVTTIGFEAFSICSALASVYMPEVTTIDAGAFSRCSALTSVDIPASVSMISWRAFERCSGLTSVYCHWVEPLECDPEFTDEVLENAILFVPRETVDAYRSVKPWSDFANIVEARYSGIADATAPEVVIKVIDGAITVEGGDGTASAPVVEVYSAGGVCVYRGTDTVIGGLTHGVYVVKVGGTVQKVAL